MARLSPVICLVLLALTVSAKRRPAQNAPKHHPATSPATAAESASASTEAAASDFLNPIAANIPFPPFALSPVTPLERNRHPKKRRGYKGKDIKQNRAVLLMPPSFDARLKWPSCQTLKTIPNQGACGTCWAVNAACVLSDRICIDSAQTITNMFLSANQAASCTSRSTWYTPDQNCVAGGLPADVYQYAKVIGIETGYRKYTDAGALVDNTMQACVPYPVNPAAGTIPLTCATTGCSNTGYTAKTFANDKNQVADYFFDYEFYDYINHTTRNYAQMPAANRSSAIYEMQLEIMTKGPISAIFDVWSDFQAWVGGAPYNGPSSTALYRGGHVLKLIGWNYMTIANKNVSYWIGVNSWGPSRGVGGLYYVEMKKNVAGIEAAWGAPYITI